MDDNLVDDEFGGKLDLGHSGYLNVRRQSVERGNPLRCRLGQLAERTGIFRGRCDDLRKLRRRHPASTDSNDTAPIHGDAASIQYTITSDIHSDTSSQHAHCFTLANNRTRHTHEHTDHAHPHSNDRTADIHADAGTRIADSDNSPRQPDIYRRTHAHTIPDIHTCTDIYPGAVSDTQTIADAFLPHQHSGPRHDPHPNTLSDTHR